MAEAEALVEVLGLAGEAVGMGIKQPILLILHPVLHGRMVQLSACTVVDSKARLSCASVASRTATNDVNECTKAN